MSQTAGGCTTTWYASPNRSAETRPPRPVSCRARPRRFISTGWWQGNLLDVVYQRRTGRIGPGAGRPAKLYRRSDQQVAVTLPERRYELAGQLLSSVLEHAARTGDSPRASLDQVAYQLGQQLAATARSTGDGTGTRDTALQVLEAYGFEPRVEGDGVTLANCPFRALAQAHTELVCGMNLALLDGLLDGLGRPGLTARLDPTPPYCCVRLEPAPDTEPGQAY